MVVPTFMVWCVVSLLAAVGLWERLAIGTQVTLLGGFLVGSVALSYAQIVGQGRAFISNAHMKLPTFNWLDLTVIVFAHGFLLPFWQLIAMSLTLMGSEAYPFQLPTGNFLIGLMLLGLSYLLSNMSVE
jgi:hypothetical protein